MTSHIKLVLVLVAGLCIGSGISQTAMDHTHAALYLYGAAILCVMIRAILSEIR